MGDLALSIPRGTNIGFVAATVLCEIMSQNVLSTKHLDGSSTVDAVELSEHDLKYLRVSGSPNKVKLGSEADKEGSNYLKLADELDHYHVQMVISVDEAPRLADVNLVANVRRLPLSKVTQLTQIELIVKGDGVNETVTLPVSMGSRLSSLTHEALEYLRNYGWKLTPKGDYLIDLSAWDVENPLFVLPMKHVNMVEFMDTVEHFVKAAYKSKDKRHLKTLRDYATPVEALLGLYQLVTTKLKVNIAHLEIITLSTLIRDGAINDHRLPYDRENAKVGYYEDNMVLRSLAPTMAYQKQGATLFDTRSYTVTERPDHPLDEILMGHINR
jgi:hypothetical protein